MNLLFRIVYAAHAKGTHHKLALDALRNITCADHDLWQRAFLAHAKLYLEGSKAPDDEFKDFKNHVLHTRDGFWGGAPREGAQLVSSPGRGAGACRTGRRRSTAPVCSAITTPTRCSPSTPPSRRPRTTSTAPPSGASRAAYDELYELGARDFPGHDGRMPDDPNWLVQLLCQGAERANGYYEKLIAHYDIQRGVVDPPSGLDRVAKRIVAEMIRYAYLSYAAVLDRAIERGQRARTRRRRDGCHADRSRADPGEAARPPHRQRRGAPHDRAHLRRAAGHRHGRAQPARGRPRGARAARAGSAGRASAAAAGVEGVSVQAARAGRHAHRPGAGRASRPRQPLGRGHSAARRSADAAAGYCLAVRLQPAAAAVARTIRCHPRADAVIVPASNRRRHGGRARRAPRAGLTDRLERIARRAPRPRRENEAPAEPEVATAGAIGQPALLSHARPGRRRRSLHRAEDGRAAPSARHQDGARSRSRPIRRRSPCS